MEQDNDGAFLMEQGDIFGTDQDPNLSGAPFQVVREGDGDYVATTGLGNGDPTVVKVRRGSLIRGVFDVDPVGAEAYTAEQKAQKRSFVSVVNGSGEKVDLGSWPEEA